MEDEKKKKKNQYTKRILRYCYNPYCHIFFFIIYLFIHSHVQLFYQNEDDDVVVVMRMVHGFSTTLSSFPIIKHPSSKGQEYQQQHHHHHHQHHQRHQRHQRQRRKKIACQAVSNNNHSKSPSSKPNTSASSSSTTPLPTQKQSPFQKRLKSWIVLVDDEESIRLSLGNYLYQEGYTVTACADAEALLEILYSISSSSSSSDISSSDISSSDSAVGKSLSSSSSTTFEYKFPQAIICDIRMPGEGMDGLDLLTILKNPQLSSPSSSSWQLDSSLPLVKPVTAKILKKFNPKNNNNNNNEENNVWDKIRQQWKRIPVIILSAKSLTQDRIEGYRRGADVYLSKPFSPEELLSIVDNMIERTRILTGGSDGDGNDIDNSNDHDHDDKEMAIISVKRINEDTTKNVTLTDLKNEISEIKSLLLQQASNTKNNNPQRNLLLGSSATTADSDKNNHNNDAEEKEGGNRMRRQPLMYISPSSSALVPISKTQKKKVNGAKISAMELNDFNQNIKLTPTEEETLNLVSQGYTNGEIAKLRGVSTTSVSRSISSLYAKTLTKTRTELVKWGIQSGHISTK